VGIYESLPPEVNGEVVVIQDVSSNDWFGYLRDEKDRLEFAWQTQVEAG
jgi:hypothetical protein